MRLRADKTIKDDLPQVRPWLALQPGESAITGIREAELTFEADSDQHYAARIVSEFRVFQRAIRKPYNKEFALYLAARLRELVGEWELSPEMRREAQRVRGLRELNVSRKELGQERKARLLALALAMKDNHPSLTKTAIALVLALQEARIKLLGKKPPPTEMQIRQLAKQMTRQIRKYLKTL